MATFGSSPSSISSLNGGDAADWLKVEFSKPIKEILPGYVARKKSGEKFQVVTFGREIWDKLVGADDQLRQRMVFALSQIIVANDEGRVPRMAHYYDILQRNAFGNYRDLLEEITYSPRMGDFLTYLRNRGDQEGDGRMPDENYAREIMQLFSIGLIELNMDGTPKLDGSGRQIPTYDNEDVIGLSRVFTGLSLDGERFGNSGGDDSWYIPMAMYEDYHSPHAKSFLGTTIPAGTSGTRSIDIALDAIFEHPNVAPFVSRQLIQRFTMSSPPPSYVQRVAMAFEMGRYTSGDGDSFGTGNRGDLQATLAAVLLDPSLRQSEDNLGSHDGKIREPVLQLAHIFRAFRFSNLDADNEKLLRDMSSPSSGIGMTPYRSPSVFNFYRPGFIAPTTEAGDAGMTTPEFQIVNESLQIGFNNTLIAFVQDTGKQDNASKKSYVPNYSQEISLANNPTALVDHLDVLLTGGRMLEATRAQIIEAVSAMPLDSGNANAEQREKRVHLAIMMAANAPSFIIQR